MSRQGRRTVCEMTAIAVLAALVWWTVGEWPPRRKWARAALSRRRTCREWIDTLVRHQLVGVENAGADVVRFEEGIGGYYILLTVARGEHGQDVFDGQPSSANDGLAAQNCGVRDDAAK